MALAALMCVVEMATISKDSALRWKLNGANLGTTSRSLDGSVSDQGKWKLNLGYDELRHNITDTFQTPLQGNPGGNNFTLPARFWHD